MEPCQCQAKRAGGTGNFTALMCIDFAVHLPDVLPSSLRCPLSISCKFIFVQMCDIQLLLASVIRESDGGKLGVVIGERRLFPRRPPVEVIRRIC